MGKRLALHERRWKIVFKDTMGPQQSKVCSVFVCVSFHTQLLVLSTQRIPCLGFYALSMYGSIHVKRNLSTIDG